MKTKMIVFFRYCILITVLFLLSLNIIENFDEYAFITTLNGVYLIPIVLLCLLNIFLDAIRYFFTTKEMGTRIPLFSCFVHLIIARFLGKLVPQSGAAYKIQAMKKAGGLNFGEAVSGLASLTWMQLFLTLILAIVTTGIYRIDLQIADTRVVDIFGFAVFLLVFGTVIVAYIFTKYNVENLIGLHFFRRVSLKVTRHIRLILVLIGNPTLLVIAVVSIISGIAVSVLRLYFCFKMFDIDTEIAVLMIFITINRVLTVMVLTPGNVGITEFIFGFLAKEMDIGMAQGIATALVLRLIMFTLLAVSSLFFYVFSRHIVVGAKKPES